MLELDKIVLFGDSIFERSSDPELSFSLNAALQNAYQRRLDIVNRGFSGYNTRHARHIITPLLEAENRGDSVVRLVVLFFGTNDAATNWQGVPVDEYRDNLRYIAQEALNSESEVVVVGVSTHGPVPAEDEPDSRSNERNLLYNHAAKAVADELGLAFVDLFSAFKGSQLTTQQLLPDGIHYSGDAYKLFYNELAKRIRIDVSNLDPDALPRLLPHYSELENVADVKAALHQSPLWSR